MSTSPSIRVVVRGILSLPSLGKLHISRFMVKATSGRGPVRPG
jgi:hypothetical protein